MKSTISAIALAAVAGIASAQTFTIGYDFGGADSSALAENTTYSVTVSVAFEGGQDNLLAAGFDAAMSGSLSDIGNIAIDSDYQGQGGGVAWDGSTLSATALAPTSLFVPAVGSPQDLFSFDLTTGSAGDIDVAISNVLFTTFNAQFMLSDHTVTNDSATFTVVPTPGALAVAGLGGLVAARRRR